jgi:hypothetical protein
MAGLGNILLANPTLAPGSQQPPEQEEQEQLQPGDQDQSNHQLAMMQNLIKLSSSPNTNEQHPVGSENTPPPAPTPVQGTQLPAAQEPVPANNNFLLQNWMPYNVAPQQASFVPVFGLPTPGFRAAPNNQMLLQNLIQLANPPNNHPRLPPASPVPYGSKTVPIYIDYDEEALTDYQCLLRKQIELFEAIPDDVQASAQGRNNPILLGQVGIRCRHCVSLPIKSRPRGAVY